MCECGGGMTRGVRLLGDSGWRRLMAGEEADVVRVGMLAVGAGEPLPSLAAEAAAEGERTAWAELQRGTSSGLLLRTLSYET